MTVLEDGGFTELITLNKVMRWALNQYDCPYIKRKLEYRNSEKTTNYKPRKEALEESFLSDLLIFDSKSLDRTVGK